MSLKSLAAKAAGFAGALVLPLTAHAQAAPSPPAAGEAVFNAYCKACHDPNIDRAPARATLAPYPPAQIIDALTNGVMKPMAAGLSDEDKPALAAYLTGAK